MTKQLQLNQDQQTLLDSLDTFWKSYQDKIFLLQGQAGVGKTTCVRYFLDKIQTTSVCLTAPTNKAVKVLRSATDNDDYDYKTIYSLLGLTMQANGAVKELTDAGKKDVAGSYDLIVIDEASMLPDIVLKTLHKKTALSNTKILIIGDKEQLPPVGFDESPIWSEYPINYELTEVMRHQNSILTFVQSVRANRSPKFISSGHEVIIHEEDAFIAKIIEMADSGMFHSGQAKAIAWRNVTVNFLNKLIRDHVTKSADPFVKGDRVIFTAPVMNEQNIPLASTDEEGIVKTFSRELHPKFKNYRIISLNIKTESGNMVNAKIIDPDDADKLEAALTNLSSKKMWKDFWSLKEAFNTISYAYALTAHRSQGSTFEHVFLDAGDIMLNRQDPVTRTKCLYVGSSRASKFLHIFP